MDFNIEVRKKQLQSLDNYISSSKDRVQSILDSFGWDVKKLCEEDKRVVCPINTSHRIHPKSSKGHVEKCTIQSEGYEPNEKFLSEPIHNINSSIKLDRDKKTEVFDRAKHEYPNFKTVWKGNDPDPRSADRFFTTYSSNERLALYDYVVTHTVGPTPPQEFGMFEEEPSEEKLLSANEIRAIQRDMKRRQVKYKSVHTNRKTHTEVLHQMIENQMAVYSDWLRQKGAQSDPQTSQANDCDRHDDALEQTDSALSKKRHDNILRENGLVEDDQYMDSSNCDISKSERKVVVSSAANDCDLKHRRPSSPGEQSNCSSSRSRKRYKDGGYSRTSSRNSSLDSMHSINSKYKEAGYNRDGKDSNRYRRDEGYYESRKYKRRHEDDRHKRDSYHRRERHETPRHDYGLSRSPERAKLGSKRYSRSPDYKKHRSSSRIEANRRRPDHRREDM